MLPPSLNRHRPGREGLMTSSSSRFPTCRRHLLIRVTQLGAFELPHFLPRVSLSARRRRLLGHRAEVREFARERDVISQTM